MPDPTDTELMDWMHEELSEGHAMLSTQHGPWWRILYGEDGEEFDSRDLPDPKDFRAAISGAMAAWRSRHYGC